MWSNMELVLIAGLLFQMQGLYGEEVDPALRKIGESVTLSWKLPDNLDNVEYITIAKDMFSQLVFVGSTQSDMIDIPDEQYKDRIQALPLNTGTVSFTIQDVTAADAGRYICYEGISDIRIPRCGQMLVIIDQPVDVRTKVKQHEVVGQDLILECMANSTSLPADHDLPLNVQWFDSSGLQVMGEQDKVQVNGTQLLVRSIQRHDEGLHFTCRAADGLDLWSADSQPYTLRPEFSPTENDIVLKPERGQVVVRSGGLVQQECGARCRPDCNIAWQKLQIGEGGYLGVQDDKMLSLPGIQRDQDGRYRCVASNVHGEASRSLDVVVTYAPTLQSVRVNGMEQNKARVTEGIKVKMTCMFDSNPAPQVTWYSQQDPNRVLLQQDLSSQTPVISETGQVPRSTYTTDFIIASTDCTNTNQYTCSAKNSLGAGIDGQIDLDVVCMPRNTEGELRLETLYMSPVDQPVDIKFQVVAYPEPTIERVISEDASGRRRLESEDRWTQSSSKSPAHPYLTTITLRFPNPTIEFFDKTYYMDISNNEGSKPFAFRLMAKGPPRPPVNLTAIAVGDSRVVLRFIPGFHGGKPQTFSVEYRLVRYNDNTTQNWVEVNTLLKESQDSHWVELEVGGLEPGSTYNFRVHATNEHGTNTSAVLVVTTTAAAASSADAGSIAGIVIGVLVVIIIVCVIVYLFVFRRRRDSDEADDGQTKEPMLGGEDDRGSSPGPQGTGDNAVETKSHIHTVPSTEDHGMKEKSSPTHEDERLRNQDGLIYADLDLSKSSETTSAPARQDAVNYETIDFTRRPPNPPLASIELPSDEEEVK